MPNIDRQAAQRLLRERPPEYTPPQRPRLHPADGPHDPAAHGDNGDDGDTEFPATEFDIEEVDVDDVTSGGVSNWLGTLKHFGSVRITRSVGRVVDPVFEIWRRVSSKIEERVSRIMNPLVAKRISVLAVVAVALVVINSMYFTDQGSLPALKNHERLLEFIRSEVSSSRLQGSTQFLAKMPHLAGSQADKATANFVHDTFESLGLPALFDRHDVFLSHGNHTLAELRVRKTGEVLFASNLTEGTAPTHDQASEVQPPTQMALVVPGDATGPLVYLNFAQEEDFTVVKESIQESVNEAGGGSGESGSANGLKGAIGIVKLGNESPGLLALRAQEHGLAGVLFMAEKHAGEASWPDGRDYPHDAIPQASLGWPAIYPGDILSPGWPSSDRMQLDLDKAYIATIPVAAISWHDAERLLTSLKGYGRLMFSDSGAPTDGHSGESWGNNGVPDVGEWYTGPNWDHEFHLSTHPIAESRHQIANVFGHLQGREEADRVVVIGARIDAMCYGASQLAGLNVVLEVARIFSALRRSERWQPLRSIYFALWDGTSHNFAGATEWVEGVAKSLSEEGVAYIDLDAGISGGKLQARGNPIIDLAAALKRVEFEDRGVSNRMIDGAKDGINSRSSKDVENGGKPKTLMDYVSEDSFIPIPNFGNHIAFDAHTGVPTVQLGWVDPDGAVPIDSCYDSLDWMERFGDPDWSRHAALAELVAGLALELADAPMIPYDFKGLGLSVLRNMNFIKSRIESRYGKLYLSDNNGDVDADDAADAAADEELARAETENNAHVDHALRTAVKNLYTAGHSVINRSQYRDRAFQDWMQFKLMHADEETGDLVEMMPVAHMRHRWNDLAAEAIKSLIDIKGLPNRNWYKNHFMGPTRYDSKHYLMSGVLPGVQDSLMYKSWEDLMESLQDAEAHIRSLAMRLGDFDY